MKRVLLFFCMLVAGKLSAQLLIQPGAQLAITDSGQVTFQDINFINNGLFTAGSGIITFSGNTPSVISGSQQVQFYNLEINKIGASTLSLQRPFSVAHYMYFTGGNIDLNGFTIDLGSTGFLIHELESSHIVGSSGGKVIANAVLNAPIGANPGNLGAYISTDDNLGNVIIARGHQSQVNGAGGGNSILRYYDIKPANPSSTVAVLRLAYLDAELNGLPESSLVLWNSTDSTHWTRLGSSLNDASLDYAEQTTPVVAARFTLSGVNNALPVRFISLNTACNGSNVLVTWKTATEQNVHYYTIERSADAIHWTASGSVTASANTAAEHDYAYTDNAAIAGSYYRIAEYDMDGRSQFSKLVKNNCSTAEPFSVFPNPVSELVYISMSATSSSTVTIKVYDSKGALVKQQAGKLLTGNNIFSMDMQGLVCGPYYMIVSNNSGLLRTQKLLKQ